VRRLLLYSHQDSEFDGLGRIEMISIGQALERREVLISSSSWNSTIR
jgi:hypothetical protein